MPTVTLPDGKEISFPEGMGAGDILKALSPGSPAGNWIGTLPDPKTGRIYNEISTPYLEYRASNNPEWDSALSFAKGEYQSQGGLMEEIKEDASQATEFMFGGLANYADQANMNQEHGIMDTAIAGAEAMPLAPAYLGAVKRFMKDNPLVEKAFLNTFNPRRDIIGSTGAKNADMAALSKAEEMKAAGIDTDTIYNETGWFLDHPDGRPRFEINDSGARAKELSEWGRASQEDFKRGNTVTGHVGEFLDHKDLADQYSGLVDFGDNNTRLTMGVRRGGGDNASYTPEEFGGGHIRLSAVEDLEGGARINKTAAGHELQHAIQQRENMARGGSPGDFSNVQYEARFNYLNSVDEKLNNGIGELAEKTNGIKEILAIRAKYPELYEDYRSALSDLGASNLQEGRAAIFKSFEQADELSPYTKYQSLAGEAEARLVQNRMDMPMFERLANPFYKGYDVPLEDQIVRYGDDTSMSMPMDEASRMQRADDMFPIDAYHGANRIDRVLENNSLNPKKATSGPMPYFTNSPDLGSSYSLNKKDTSRLSESDFSYSDWFKYKPKGARTEKQFDAAWNYLPKEEQKQITNKLSQIGFVDDDYTKIGFTSENVGGAGRDHWEHTMRENNGNALAAARDLWLDSGQLYGQEEEFLKVLDMAGLKNVKYDSPHLQVPGVLTARLRIDSPLKTNDTAAINGVLDKLEIAGKKKRYKSKQWGADMWDKNTIGIKEFTDRLKTDIKEGTTHAWTSIPDDVTKLLEDMGFDGVIDVSGKGGGAEHAVYIPFKPNQVRSRFAKFDPAKKDSANLLDSRLLPIPAGFEGYNDYTEEY